MVFASFLVQFYNFGIATSNGLLMIEFLRYFDEGASVLSSVFTIAVFMGVFAAPIIGYMVTRYGARAVATVGAGVHCIAMITSAFAESVPHLIITHGLLNGVGILIIYIPGVAILAKYFDKRYAFANGIAGVGSGTGAIVFPLLIEFCIRTYGWHGTFFILTGCSANLFVCAAIMKPAWRPRAQKQAVMKEILEEDINRNERQSATEKNEIDECTCEDELISNGDEYKSDLNSNHDKYKTEIKTETEMKSGTKCSLITRIWGFHLLRQYPPLISFVFCTFTFGAYSMTMIVWIVVRSVDVGIPRIDAAMLMTYLGVSAIASRFLTGWIIDLKFVSPATLLSAMLFLNTIFVSVFTFAHRYVVMALCCAGIGLCQGMIFPLISVIVRNIVGADNFAAAFGLVVSTMQLGACILIVAGKVYEITGDSRTPFFLASTSIALATVLSTVTAFVMYYTRKRALPGVGSKSDHQRKVHISPVRDL
ncbi:monocarboxylate transporter 14-like [Glandiceps talaboti]